MTRDPGVENTGAAPPAAIARLQHNHARFVAEVSIAEAHLAAGRPDEAVMHASLASAIAAHTHCGVFASSRLERIAHAVGMKLTDEAPTFPRKKSAGEIRRVLHVATEVAPIGGLSRMISRWMDADASRANSFVVTRQRNSIPDHLIDAVSRSGGEIHQLNKQAGSQFEWAQRLRQIGRRHDLIVLHIHCEDMIPLIAFADAARSPPVLMLNHADHLFWLGPGVSHAVLNLREAAHDITINRRGVERERSLFLPTLIQPAKRLKTREEARAALGIAPDEQLIISVARGVKYRTMDGVSYADRFVDVLKENPKAKCIVVGAGMPDDWQRASDETGGRIKGLAERPDVSIFFEAADIYVDSYPFSSSTSLMEAASYGLPLLTLFTLPEDARLLGINHLGLIGGVIQARSPHEWQRELARLIQDPSWRDVQSANARKAVGCALPPEWLQWLETCYQRACELPPLQQPSATDADAPFFGEPDWRHEAVYGNDHPLADLTRDYVSALPLAARLRVWNRLRRTKELGGLGAALRLLVPEWVKRNLKRRT